MRCKFIILVKPIEHAWKHGRSSLCCRTGITSSRTLEIWERWYSSPQTNLHTQVRIFRYFV